MFVKEKRVDNYHLYVDLDCLAYTVVVRKVGEQRPIFYRTYSSSNSAYRSFNRWCSKINEIDCSEVLL